MQLLVNYDFVIHLLCLKVTSACVICIMSHVKLCNHYSDVVISSNATERHVASIIIFMLEDGLILYITSYEHILCFTRGSCHDKDSNLMHVLYVKVISASVRCVIM